MQTLRVVIGLGSNVGDRLATLRGAVSEIATLGSIESVSAMYETAPVGGPDQPDYLNAAVVLRTALEPDPLLDRLQRIEKAAGRERTVPWGPRTLDLDVLWIEGRRCDAPRLRVPHPRLCERAFALRPLLDVAPDARDPTTGERYADVLARLDVGEGSVRVAFDHWATW
jgi:2-amino-4-hydroxy-6-hydroxymethyldihydropteridine diphosphokinase